MAFIRFSSTSGHSVEEIKKAIEILAPALGSDLRTIFSEVAQGTAHLFCADNECYFILRGEQDLTRRELVIVAMAGKNSKMHTPKIHRYAKQNNYQSIRCHTMRPDAFLRLGRDLGYQRAETILRAVL